MEARQWYFATGGTQQGPVSETEIAQMFASGRLRPETLVWTQGMSNWAAASTISGLVPISPVIGVRPPQMFDIRSVQYAGFWKRFAAHIIDSILVYILTLIGGFVIGLLFGLSMAASDVDEQTIGAMAGLLGFVVGIIISWLYYTLFESSTKQATPGKMALGIIVTDMQGGRISFGKANGRYWAKIISFLILMIGFIMVAFTEKKQGLHDMMAGCLVVNK